MSQAKASNQGTKIWPDLEAPKGFMSGYKNAPAPGKVRGSLGRAAEGAVEHALKQGSKRITKINEGTRAGIRKRINEAIEQGMTPQEAGAYVREWTGFDEYRAERIARTEMMFSYNEAAIGTYREVGITQVVADDGDEDEECAERHGQVFDVDEAAGIVDHPNGTLDWLPVDPSTNAETIQRELSQERDVAQLEEKVAAGQSLLGATSVAAQVVEAVEAVAPLLPASDMTLASNGRSALEKLRSGADLPDDEVALIEKAIQAKHITSTEYMDAYGQGKLHQHASRALEKLRNGDPLTNVEEDAFQKLLTKYGIDLDAQYQEAAAIGQKMKDAKAAAKTILDDIGTGKPPTPQAQKQLQDLVDQGVVTQAQADEAYLVGQENLEVVANAVNKVAQGFGSSNQGAIIDNAFSQGVMGPAQRKELGDALLDKMKGGQHLTTQEEQWANKLLVDGGLNPGDYFSAQAGLSNFTQAQGDAALAKFINSESLSPDELKALKKFYTIDDAVAAKDAHHAAQAVIAHSDDVIHGALDIVANGTGWDGLTAGQRYALERAFTKPGVLSDAQKQLLANATKTRPDGTKPLSAKSFLRRKMSSGQTLSDQDIQAMKLMVKDKTWSVDLIAQESQAAADRVLAAKLPRAKRVAKPRPTKPGQFTDYSEWPTRQPLSKHEAQMKLNARPGGGSGRDAGAKLNAVDADAGSIGDSWQGSSTSMRSTAAKQAAAERRGYSLSPYERTQVESFKTHGYGHAQADEWDDMVAAARRSLDFNDAELARMGIDPDEVITIYRGMGLDSSGANLQVGTFGHVQDNSLASWSLDRDIAESFAKGQSGYGGKNGYVLEARIRMGDIAGLPSTNGIGTFYESEVVPYGGNLRKVKVLAKY